MDDQQIAKKFNDAYKVLLYRYKCEQHMNEKLKELSEYSVPKGYKVHQLTKLKGDCFFESLVFLGIGDCVEDLRLSISYIMYQFRDYPGFFPDQPKTTLKDLFKNTNEIEVVYDYDKKKALKYTYELMCRDLTSEGAWERLPTQLIMLMLSYLFELKFVIFNSQHDTVLEIEYNPPDPKAEKTEPSKKIVCLGHLIDCHYVPMIELNGEPYEKIRVPMYDNVAQEAEQFKKEYKKWQLDKQRRQREEEEREEKEREEMERQYLADKYKNGYVPHYTDFHSINKGRIYPDVD